MLVIVYHCFFVIIILIFTYNEVRFISFCTQEPTCACYFLTSSYNSLEFVSNYSTLYLYSYNRRLSVLRENFSSSKLKFLKHDIPLMALTATATIPVREDIIKSLKMSKDTTIVLTSFFRPNLRFSVSYCNYSRTSVLLVFLLCSS